MDLSIKSNLGDYKVIFQNDFSFFNDLCKINNCAFVIDRNVYELYSSKLELNNLNDRTLLFDANEENKTIESSFKIYDHLLKMEAKRNITMVSMGGGITQDVTGFVSSTLYRGINWIYIPTTLLAQTDSCIGSKTSLNYKTYKNIIGSFYPPKTIYLCPKFIDTLSDVDFFSGVGEAIKLQMMKPNFELDKVVTSIALLKTNRQSLGNVIYENLTIKIEYMENDEFDLGRRNLLNYGHCFGHALETSSNYAIPHGIAVTIGIIFANGISLNRGLITKDLFQSINNELLLNNIQVSLKVDYFNSDKILRAMENDKKRQGNDLSVVIPDGKMRLIKINDLTRSEFHHGLEITKHQLF